MRAPPSRLLRTPGDPNARPARIEDMESLGLLAIAGLLFVKEAGVPVPVPGDIVVLGAGIAASKGDLPPLPALVVIVLAGIGGGILQFGLLRSIARGPALRLLARLGVPAARLDDTAARFLAGGARAVAVVRMTPGVRVLGIAGAAVAGLPFRSFALGLSAGNAVFVTAHFGLGYVAGAPALAVVSASSLQVVVAAVAVLALLGGVGWAVIARRSRTAPRESAGTALGSVAEWADAACPACLLVAAREVAPGGVAAARV